jgi:hypothetical protein
VFSSVIASFISDLFSNCFDFFNLLNDQTRGESRVWLLVSVWSAR